MKTPKNQSELDVAPPSGLALASVSSVREATLVARFLIGMLLFMAGFLLRPTVAQHGSTDASRVAAAQACAADGNNVVAADDPLVSAAWRLGQLSRGDPYWYRDNAETGEPEISLTDPLEGWKVGVLESGREYFFRLTDDGDDTEVRLASFESEESEPSESSKAPNGGGSSSSSSSSSDTWRIGTTATGREYTWRYNPDAPEDEEPEVRLWAESVDDSGNTFWWDEGGSGEVRLHDPFLHARRS